MGYFTSQAVHSHRHTAIQRKVRNVLQHLHNVRQQATGGIEGVATANHLGYYLLMAHSSLTRITIMVSRFVALQSHTGVLVVSCSASDYMKYLKRLSGSADHSTCYKINLPSVIAAMPFCTTAACHLVGDQFDTER